MRPRSAVDPVAQGSDARRPSSLASDRASCSTSAWASWPCKKPQDTDPPLEVRGRIEIRLSVRNAVSAARAPPAGHVQRQAPSGRDRSRWRARRRSVVREARGFRREVPGRSVAPFPAKRRGPQFDKPGAGIGPHIQHPAPVGAPRLDGGRGHEREDGVDIEGFRIVPHEVQPPFRRSSSVWLSRNAARIRASVLLVPPANCANPVSASLMPSRVPSTAP
jgi:hypothetical protein